MKLLELRSFTNNFLGETCAKFAGKLLKEWATVSANYFKFDQYHFKLGFGQVCKRTNFFVMISNPAEATTLLYMTIS